MKVKVMVAALAFTFSQFSYADVVGVTAGVELWQADPTLSFGDTGFSQPLTLSDENANAFYVAFEHPMPLLPNISLRRQSIDFNGNGVLAGALQLGGENFSQGTTVNSQLKLSYNDANLYYELLDNDLISLDLGVTARFSKADAVVTSDNRSANSKLSVPLPMLYWNANVGIPATSLSLFYTGSYVNYSDNKFYDARLGLSYDLFDATAVSLALKLGVQKFDLTVLDQDGQDADFSADGAFLAVEVDF